MTEQTTSKRRTAKREVKKTQTTQNVASGTSLVEKFFPPLTAVSISAIFYFTGWIYIAHWYSYYGIDATRINIPAQIILLHGFPGILFMSACGLVALFGVTFYKNFVRNLPLQITDAPVIIISAYLISLLIIFIVVIIVLSARSKIPIPPEAWISVISLLFIVIAYVGIYQARKESQSSKTDLSGTTLALLVGVIQERGVAKGYEFLRDVTIKKDQDLLDSIKKVDRKVNEIMQGEGDRAKEIVKNSWPLWTSMVLVFYFLTSISLSAILGEWDAARGGRSLIGNWHIPEVSFFSTTSIPALEKFENKIGMGFEYKSLGLLSSDDKTYYLVDWKTSSYYSGKPNVYIIPRSDGLILNFIVSPHDSQPLAPILKIINTPTLMPTIPSTLTP